MRTGNPPASGFFWPVPAARVEIPVPPELVARGRAFFMLRGVDLIGTWSLVEWTASNVELAKARHPSGPDAVGRIIYSGDGYMSAFLARADGVSDALAYAGTWELLGGEEVVHHVTLSRVETFAGTDLVRPVSWDGDD